MAKKKVTKAKTATKARSVGFNILEQGADIVSAASEALDRSSSRVTASTVGDPNKPFLIYPVPDFVLQWLLKARGFVSGTTVNIIGAEGVAKTSFCFTMIGWGMMYNSASQYVEAEGKPMDPKRIKQCLHPDPKIAEMMFKAIRMDRAREITEAVDKIESWAQFVRDPKSPAYVPIHIPIASYLDTYSKLMSPSEAQGYAPYEKPSEESADGKKGKKKVKELGGGSNMGHSKLAHAWTRRLPALLNSYNMLLFIVSHQNDKVDMSGGGGSFVSADVAEGFNKTTIGGRAFAQSAAYQWIVTPKDYEVQQVGGIKEKVARNIKINLIKNSYGPPRQTEYRLTLMNRRSTDMYQEPVIFTSPQLPYILNSTGLLTIRTKNQNCHSCKELGVEEVDIHTFANAFYRRPDLIESLGERLGFLGYGDGKKMPDLNPYFVEHSHDPDIEMVEGSSEELTPGSESDTEAEPQQSDAA